MWAPIRSAFGRAARGRAATASLSGLPSDSDPCNLRVQGRSAVDRFIRRMPPLCKSGRVRTVGDMEEAERKARRKPRADSLRNRERLVVAARDVFAAGGPEASLEAVARRAGVGIGTLYRHFPTREALFQAVYRREADQLVELGRAVADRGRAGRGASPMAARQCRYDRNQEGDACGAGTRHRRRGRTLRRDRGTVDPDGRGADATGHRGRQRSGTTSRPRI